MAQLTKIFARCSRKSVLQNPTILFPRLRCEKYSEQNQRMAGPVKHNMKYIYKLAVVLSGKYKRISDVPDSMPHSELDRALNQARVRFSIIMMVVISVLCAGIMYKGRQDAKAGDSVLKRGLAWQEKFEKQGQEERAARAALEAENSKGK